MAAPKMAANRCGFFVEKKKRFCKMEAGRGRKYCGEHAHMEEVGGASRRITCPLDPKHTVDEDKLQKHLKKCNSREKPPPVYFVKNRNSGPDDGDETEPQSLCDRTDLDSLIAKLKMAAEGLECEPEQRVLSHAVLQDQLDDPKNGGSAHKHLRQQSSILGHLDDLGLLARGRCFVEFGAGRGKLSHWILEALKTSRDRDQDQEDQDQEDQDQEDLQLLLVERSTTRFKMEGKHQASGVELERLQVDIQHLDLGRVPMIQKKKFPLVAVGKHLCGSATDLALRCLFETPEDPDPEDPDSAGPPQKRAKAAASGPLEVLGLVVALCCHHRCRWNHYVGQRFFLDRGLGPAHFSAFCRMSSWATCGLRDHGRDRAGGPADQTGDENPLSPWERQEVGRLCKRLIDSGRLHFLSSRGFRCRVLGYVPDNVTPENVLLTAVPSQ